MLSLVSSHDSLYGTRQSTSKLQFISPPTIPWSRPSPPLLLIQPDKATTSSMEPPPQPLTIENSRFSNEISGYGMCYRRTLSLSLLITIMTLTNSNTHLLIQEYPPEGIYKQWHLHGAATRNLRPPTPWKHKLCWASGCRLLTLLRTFLSCF